MAEIEAHSPVPLPDDQMTVESVDTSAQPDVHAEHEVSDVVEPEAIAQEGPSEGNVPADNTVHDDDAKDPKPAGEPKIISPKPGVTRKVATTKPAAGSGKDKPAVSLKAAPAKSNGPPTPTVKKIINSGTFGAGAVKHTAPGSKTPTTTASSALSKSTSTALSKSTSTAPSALKKSVSSSSANPPVKAPAMSSSRSSGAGAPPSRRSSVIPPRSTTAPAPRSRGSLLSAITSRSSQATPPVDAKEGSTRPSVVSPAGSVASLKSSAAPPSRPRASISDAVKRIPSRTSLMGNTPASPAPARTIRPVGSISSIREVREDGKNLEELQKRLKEAVDDLSAKSEAAAALEEQVAELKASLDTALADTDAKGATISELEAARDASVSEIEQLRESHVKLQEDREKDLLVLETVQNELENAKAASFDQTELIETLQDQIAALETQVSAAKDDLDVLRAAHDNNSSDAAAAAQIEREALLKAKADLEAIGAETEALRASHSAVLEDLAEKLRDAEDRASGAEALEREVAGLKAEKDENASKLSELEIEILELRESQDQAEDEHSETISRLQKLEEELAQAAAATQQALDDAQAKEEEHALQTQNLQRLHDEQLQAAKDDLAAMATSLQALESQLTEAYGAHEQTRCDAEAAADEHTREIEEAEQAQLSLQIELSEEIKRITAELEGQEAQYNAKVDAVKAEHDILLQEAFERAKNEAGSAHGEDLQGLRAESQATIEQLRSAHQSTIEGLKAEHEEVIQSTVGDLDKRLNSQALDLRATQDDLAKAKAALDASRAESESLKAKLEDARAAFISASASPDQAAEIERLSQEIANIRDENVMLSDVLAVTKVSLTEMSTNHTRELEEAAKSRVEEVTKLRAAHESEITDLATQKSEIALKLSDLDGELATLKASLAAEPSNQKSNGTMHTASPQLTVPKEDLQRAHEAHNMKLHDMRAEFDRLAKALREENEMSQATIEELRQEVGRKNMEIQYLEQEQEESQDHITRLKEDMETLAEQHKPMEAVSTA